MLSMHFEIKDALKNLEGQKKQLPFATSRAINLTANDVRDEEQYAMNRELDRPTPYIMRSVLVKYSSKSRLQATIYLNDKANKGTPASKILEAQIGGGERKAKPIEIWLQSKGILPNGSRVVPARGMKLDRFGNLPNARIKDIMNNLGLGRNDKSKAYFVMKGVGIWERNGKKKYDKIKPILIFVSEASYKAKYDYVAVGTRAVYKNFRKNFERAWAEANGKGMGPS